MQVDDESLAKKSGATKQKKWIKKRRKSQKLKKKKNLLNRWNKKRTLISKIV